MATLELNPIPTGTQPAAEAAKPPAGTTVVDVVTKAIEGGADVAALTRLYLKLRNAKKDLDDQAKTKTKPVAEAMDKIEAHFLTQMNTLGVDSLKNEAGTPYKSETVSVTVADNSTFLDFVLMKAMDNLPISAEAKQTVKNAMLESGALALVEARAAKSAVEAYLEETQELPPGLNRRKEAKVNVRAS